MPLHLEGPSAEDLQAEEAGQLVYETLAEVVGELEPGTLMALVAAVQRRDDWRRLSPTTREIFADLDERLFNVEED